MSTPCDAIVIGSGQAAPSLAVRLAEAGLKTVLVEREHLGGTCVNDGCIPTKTLVASARTARRPARRRVRGERRTRHGGHEGGEGAQGCRYGRIARGCRAVLEDVEGMYGP